MNQAAPQLAIEPSGGVRLPFALQLSPPRSRTWREVEGIGHVSWDKYRGWHIDFRRVAWPGADKPRRVRINNAPDYGRFESEIEAQKALLKIQAQLLDGRQLYEVLSHYKRDVPEDRVLHRWNVEWLPEVRRRATRKQRPLSAKRREQFERYEARGYLAYWSQISIHAINEGTVYRWLAWLEQSFPHLKPRTLKHIVDDFGTFARYLRRIGSITKAPELPTIDVPPEALEVPELVDLDRILAAIPEEIRGLWLSRGKAGLRPAEARRLDVHEYRDGVIHVPGEKSKTRRPRDLLIRDVVPELDAWILQHRAGAWGGEPLFLNLTGRGDRRWKETTERRVWLRALAAAGYSHVRPNAGGRHAFATHMIDDGVDPHALQHWLGHTTLTTTERYNHVRAVTLSRRMLARRAGPKPDQARQSTRKPEVNR